MHDQLTDDEKRDLEVKRLKARIEHLSTKNAVLKNSRNRKVGCHSQYIYEPIQALATMVNPDVLIRIEFTALVLCIVL